MYTEFPDNLVQIPRLAHGKQLLETILAHRCLEQARSDVGGSVKRPRSGSEYQFIAARAPDAQVVLLREVTVDTSNWREGLNRDIDNLRDRMLAWTQAELDKQQLTVQRSDHGWILASMKPLKDIF